MNSASAYANRASQRWRGVPAVWKRRVVLMAAVGLVVAIPVTLLVRGGSGQQTTAPAATPAIPQQFRLHGEVRLHDLGVAVKVPDSWSATRKRSTVRLRSADRTTALAVAAPGAAGKHRQVLGSELEAIRDGYRDVHVTRGVGKTVGGLPAKGAVVSARTRSGTRLRILLAVASGEDHTYLVEVFSAANAPPQRLIQAQLALRTLTLTR
jgi:hypothetical protein